MYTTEVTTTRTSVVGHKYQIGDTIVATYPSDPSRPTPACWRWSPTDGWKGTVTSIEVLEARPCYGFDGQPARKDHWVTRFDMNPQRFELWRREPLVTTYTVTVIATDNPYVRLELDKELRMMIPRRWEELQAQGPKYWRTPASPVTVTVDYTTHSAVDAP